MGVFATIATVLFVILCVLLSIIILMQSDKSAGMGILGGSSQSAFGSSTADVITKATGIMVAIFLIGSLGLAILQSYQEKTIQKDLMMEEVKTSGEIEEKTGMKDKEEKPGITGQEKKTEAPAKDLKGDGGDTLKKNPETTGVKPAIPGKTAKKNMPGSPR